jgi:hypothetical protein
LGENLTKLPLKIFINLKLGRCFFRGSRRFFRRGSFRVARMIVVRTFLFLVTRN